MPKRIDHTAGVARTSSMVRELVEAKSRARSLRARLLRSRMIHINELYALRDFDRKIATLGAQVDAELEKKNP